MINLSSNLGLKHLRLVAALNAHGSLSKAAGHLNLTQSALSHQLRKLETICKQPLFHRHGNKLVPTLAGDRLLHSATDILKELEALSIDLDSLAKGLKGRISLSSECYTSFHWLPEIIERFGHSHPDVEVNVRTPVSQDLFTQLENGDIDIAITLQAAPQKFSSQTLFADDLVVLFKPEHRFAERKTLLPANLAEETLITYAHGQEKLLHLLFGESPEALPKVIDMPLTEGILEWCRAGLGVAVMARWAARPYIESGDLLALPIKLKGARRSWYGVTLKDAKPSYIDEFLECIREQAPVT